MSSVVGGGTKRIEAIWKAVGAFGLDATSAMQTSSSCRTRARRPNSLVARGCRSRERRLLQPSSCCRGRVPYALAVSRLGTAAFLSGLPCWSLRHMHNAINTPVALLVVWHGPFLVGRLRQTFISRAARSGWGVVWAAGPAHDSEANLARQRGLIAGRIAGHTEPARSAPTSQA